MSIETMTKLATVTVGAGGSSSIEFTNIPQTYTDLKILLSIKDVTTGTSGATYLDVRINGSTTGYVVKRLVGFGSSITSNSAQTSGFMSIGYFGNSRTTMADMFTNAELYFANYTGSNYKSISCDFAMPDNTTTGPYTGFGAGMWENTSAINSILIRADGVNLAQYSKATLYGIRNMARAAGNSVKATGGNISFDGTYVVHTFNTSGTFTPTVALPDVDYLVVAGGGGGGGFGGGGGGGGMRSTVTGTGGSGSLESAISLSPNINYAVIVGAGGAGGTGGASRLKGVKGSNSAISPIVESTGGGGGAGFYENSPASTFDGGSGGGGANSSGSGSYINGGSANPSGQGFAGGRGYRTTGIAPSSYNALGGGGGAAAAGSDGAGTGTTPVRGAGGAGRATNISGVSATYAAGGTGGAEIGANTGGSNASPNTGNGADGGTGIDGNANGGAGGSGIVIIRYKA